MFVLRQKWKKTLNFHSYKKNTCTIRITFPKNKGKMNNSVFHFSFKKKGNTLNFWAGNSISWNHLIFLCTNKNSTVLPDNVVLNYTYFKLENCRRKFKSLVQYLLFSWNFGRISTKKFFSLGYTKDCNPSALTEFASAAFRIGHSLLRPFMPRMSSSYQPLDPPILLRDTFFNPDIIYQVILRN